VRPDQLSSNDNVVWSGLRVATKKPKAPVTRDGTSLRLLIRATNENPLLLLSLASEGATTAKARTTGSTNCIDRIFMGPTSRVFDAVPNF
jgi:hypothetical protein